MTSGRRTIPGRTSRGNAVPKDYNEIMRSVSASLRSPRQDTPAVIASFNALADAAKQDGELSKTTKELIALALGVAGHCDACIGFHVKALVKLGATRRAVEEAFGVAVYMGGGPSLMYAADALTAFDELVSPALPPSSHRTRHRVRAHPGRCRRQRHRQARVRSCARRRRGAGSETLRAARDRRACLRHWTRGVGYVAPAYVEGLIDGLRNAGKKILVGVQRRAQASGQPLEALLIESLGGNVAHTILAQARKVKADLIVLGTHGRRGVARIVMGSDTETVVREATFLCPSRGPSHERKWRRVDGAPARPSPGALAAAPEASRLAELPQTPTKWAPTHAGAYVTRSSSPLCSGDQWPSMDRKAPNFAAGDLRQHQCQHACFIRGFRRCRIDVERQRQRPRDHPVIALVAQALFGFLHVLFALDFGGNEHRVAVDRNRDVFFFMPGISAFTVYAVSVSVTSISIVGAGS